MAVHELWNVTVVLDIDGDLLPLFDAKQRTGRAAVVADRMNDLLRGNLDFAGAMRSEMPAALQDEVVSSFVTSFVPGLCHFSR